MTDLHIQRPEQSNGFPKKQGEHVVCFGDIHGHLGAAEEAIALAERIGVPAVFLVIMSTVDRITSGFYRR